MRVLSILTFCGFVSCQYHDWKKAYEEADRLLSGLTTLEKQLIGMPSFLGGPKKAGFPTGIIGKDGPAGLDGGIGVSGWVSPQTIASSWDTELIAMQSKEIAEEFRKKGYNAIMGPTTGPLGRTVWGGRLFEGYGSDPYLNGKLFASAVSAIQANGVIAIGKHFIANEQETDRTAATPNQRSNSVVDDRTMHEIYLWPWADGIKSGLGSVMCSMNRVNGIMACENDKLLNVQLKQELGFNGYVCADATAVVNSTAAAFAGLDENFMLMMTMRNKTGKIPDSIINDHVRRMLATQLNYHLPANQYGKVTSTAKKNVRSPGSGALIRKMGAESIVLLKNTDNVLPIRNPTHIGVFGISATNRMDGPTFPIDIFSFLGDTYPGHLAAGGGSAAAPNPYLITPLEALNARASNGTGFSILTLTSNNPPVTPQPGGKFGLGVPYSIQSVASSSEHCLVFLNAYSKEGADRKALADAEGDKLVQNVAKYCNNTIVVLNTAGARTVDSWIDLPTVKGVLNAGLLGEQSGNAIMDVVFGDVNPSARLQYTIAKKTEDYNGKVCSCCECNFDEGLYIDYRHFDRAKIEPRFEFGFGLSYTTFEYSSAKVNRVANRTNSLSQYATGSIAEGGPTSLFENLASVVATVTNTGQTTGKEVVQLYVEFPASAQEPERVLRGFQKVLLKPGESKTVTFQLQRRDLSVWDSEKGNWKLVNGKYSVYVSKSSRKAVLTETLELNMS